SARSNAWLRHSTPRRVIRCSKGRTMNTSLIFVMVAIAIGGGAWVFLYPLLAGARKTERRMASGGRREPIPQRVSRSGQRSRREQVEDTLKQLEARQKT